MRGVTPFVYKSFDVLTWLPDGLLDRKGSWVKPFTAMAAPSGAIALRLPTVAATPTRSVMYRSTDRADYLEIKTFLDARLGRAAPFWMPSFQRELVVVSSTATTVTVKYCAIAQRFTNDAADKYLWFMDQGGERQTVLMMTAAVDNEDGTETITFSTNASDVAGTAGVVTDAEPASRLVVGSALRLSRLDSDTVEVTWYTPVVCDVAVGTIALPVLQGGGEEDEGGGGGGEPGDGLYPDLALYPDVDLYPDVEA